ncbi:MAG: hypothetical protein RLZZ303_2557 [Candidatus Hydrogenedentota bacterium]
MTLRPLSLGFLASCLIASASAWAAPGDVFYVSAANDTGNEDGLSWDTAFTRIEQGIERARASFGGEVWVARGFYGGPRPANGSLQLRSGVDVYGGFAGTETTRTRRNPASNPTIIDGSAAADGNSAPAVVIGANDTVLDGFTIQGGRGSAGAGMLNVGTSPVVRNCIFRDNRATQFGGAVLNLEGSRAEFANCVFRENKATASGGAVANTESPAIFRNCLFVSNRADVAGGALFNTPGSDILVNASRFEANTSGAGGGAIFNEGASPYIENSIFIANRATGFGGAVFNNQAADVAVPSDTLMVNCVLARNVSEQGGGAFATLLSSLTLINSTIVGNTAPENLGGAFFNNAANLEVLNAIIWYNSPEWIVNTAASFTQIRWSNVGGGDPGPNNIAIEPRFVDRAADDYRLLPDSPSIDTGTPNGAPEKDLSGTSRPQLDGVDQGAYESRVKLPAEAMDCHGRGGESPRAAMPDPATWLLLATLVLARFRRQRPISA